MTLPAATQQLSANGVIQRRARCPIHDRQSSEYLGASESGWKFRCTALTQKGIQADHIFAARADPTAPKNALDAAAWMLQAKAKLAGVRVEKQLQ
jgi:hypothetical protein